MVSRSSGSICARTAVAVLSAMTSLLIWVQQRSSPIVIKRLIANPQGLWEAFRDTLEPHRRLRLIGARIESLRDGWSPSVVMAGLGQAWPKAWPGLHVSSGACKGRGWPAQG